MNPSHREFPLCLISLCQLSLVCFIIEMDDAEVSDGRPFTFSFLSLLKSHRKKIAVGFLPIEKT
jgi:hypothetical protein